MEQRRRRRRLGQRREIGRRSSARALVCVRAHTVLVVANLKRFFFFLFLVDAKRRVDDCDEDLDIVWNADELEVIDRGFVVGDIVQFGDRPRNEGPFAVGAC